jgi:phage replication O-like protein O
MANPQPDKFTRISNELFEAIMQTDFSKRQRSILDLIIRASYGCGKKFAYLKLSDFEVVGIYKSHIKKELEHLIRTKVIFMDGERISLNKDYDQWRVSLNKTSSQDKLSEILRKNLSGEVTKTVTNVTKTVTENSQPDEDEVTKTVTGGYQNSNSEVTKTVTDTPPSSTIESGPGGGLKKLKERSKETTTTTVHSMVTGTPGNGQAADAINFFEQNIGILSPLVAEKLNAWIDDTEEALVLFALEKAILAGKHNFSYAEGILRNWANKGIRTRHAAEMAEREFQRQKEQSRHHPPPGAKKHPEDRPLTSEEKKRLEELNIELAKIGKEMNFSP